MSNAPRPYPTAQPAAPPHHPGDDAQLWHWRLLLAGSVGVIVVVLIVGMVILLRKPGRSTEPARRASSAPRAWVRDLTPALAVEPPPLPPPTPPAHEKPSSPAEPAKLLEPLLEALGGLTAAHLYQTYLNMGLLADSAESEVYTPAEAKKLLETLLSLLNTVDRQLNKVGEGTLKPDDQRSLQRTRQLVGSLRTQGAELSAYWDTGDKEHSMRFHKAREEAWIGIRELLGLPE